jgi:hypothetical protein
MVDGFEVAAVVSYRGILDRSGIVAEYYTSQPAPTQWIAVGLVSARTSSAPVQEPRRLVVGTGMTEQIAVDALAHRLGAL